MKQLLKDYKRLLIKLLEEPYKSMEEIDFQTELIEDYKERNISKLKKFYKIK